MSIESVMPSNHLILCHPLLLLPSIFPSIRVFSSKSALCIRWTGYWSFSFSIDPSKVISPKVMTMTYFPSCFLVLRTNFGNSYCDIPRGIITFPDNKATKHYVGLFEEIMVENFQKLTDINHIVQKHYVLAQASLTKYHRCNGLNNRQFLTVLEAGKSRIKVLADSVPGGGLFWPRDSCLLPVSSTGGERKRGSSSFTSSFHKDTNPIMEASLS